LRLAIFGGTFDPIHNGHLAIAREAVRRCGLDRVLFVPAGIPPHKASGTRAPYADRLRMVELACQGEPCFEVSAIEAGGHTNYSIDTIRKVAATLAPADELYFLIGADAFAEIETWRRWRDVVRSVRFIVVSRAGRQYAVPEGAWVYRLDDLDVPASSSEIRRRLAGGDHAVDLPAPVLAYIQQKKLYEQPPS
jgi:nicotinate-nucleotide adenylyltransferase